MEINLTAVKSIFNKRKLVKLTSNHSLFNENDVATLKKETKTTLIRVMKSSMEVSTEKSKVVMNTEVNTSLNRKKKGSLITAKVYSKNKNELPDYHVYSRVPWLGQHDTGGIVKSVIIPNTAPGKKRMQRKTLQNILSTLKKSKKLFVETNKGKAFFYAKYDAETSKLLKDFKYLATKGKGKSQLVLVAIKHKSITNKKIMRFGDRTQWQVEEIRKEFFSQLEKE